MKRITTALATLALILAVNSGFAQEKYEFATVMYNASNSNLAISSSSGQFVEIAGEKGAAKGPDDKSPAMRHLSKMSEEGWELVSTNIEGFGIYYTLRRKSK